MVTLSIFPGNEVRLLYQHGNPDMCLAVEEAIARRGVHTMRVWTTSKCVVMGRFQNVEKEVDLPFCKENDVPVLRRFTGGGAVFLDEGVLCLSFCLPAVQNPLDIFRAISLCAAPVLGADIDEKNSLFIEEKKVSGAAGCKKWGSLFHHMTLLMGCNLELMRALTPRRNSSTSTFSEVANLERNMKVTLLEIAKNFEQKFSVTLRTGKLTQEELDLTEKLLREKYRNREWNLLGIDPFH